MQIDMKWFDEQTESFKKGYIEGAKDALKEQKMKTFERSLEAARLKGMTKALTDSINDYVESMKALEREIEVAIREIQDA